MAVYAESRLIESAEMRNGDISIIGLVSAVSSD
jgi:hypothetical protein